MQLGFAIITNFRDSPAFTLSPDHAFLFVSIMKSWNTRYIALGDGRSICLECMESAIMDTGDCQPLYHAIRDYYEGMNMRIDQQIPMLLVERQALNEAIVGEKNVTLVSSLFHISSKFSRPIS